MVEGHTSGGQLSCLLAPCSGPVYSRQSATCSKVGGLWEDFLAFTPDVARRLLGVAWSLVEVAQRELVAVCSSPHEGNLCISCVVLFGSLVILSAQRVTRVSSGCLCCLYIY